MKYSLSVVLFFLKPCLISRVKVHTLRFIRFKMLLCLFLFCPGSGRVTFNNHKSYMKAVCAGFIELKTPKFTKKVSKYTF